MTSLPLISLRELRADGAARVRAIDALGAALSDIGFFGLVEHDLRPDAVESAYAAARAFFALDEPTKKRFEDTARGGQRGYTSFGREHAKDSGAPDLKEFFQVGRTDVSDDHAVHAKYGPTPWPEQEVPAFRTAMTTLYETLERMGRDVLTACAAYADVPSNTFTDAAYHGDTILRVIHYPGLTQPPPPGAVRAAAHEDINFITLLLGATADGLELLDRDGQWQPVRAGHDEIVVDSGDMLQHWTNGLFRATTHRVCLPAPERATEPRLSMPCFMHPRPEVDLTPLAACVARTGGSARFAATTAGDLLEQRLAAIGLS